MNKILILSIILINALTLYYTKYHNISEQDATVYNLTESLLKQNRNTIDRINNGLQNEINRQAEGYSKFRVQAEQASAIRKSYHNIYKVVLGIIDEIDHNYNKEFYDKNNQIKRIQNESLNYAIAQKTLIEKGLLDSLIQTIAVQEEKIQAEIQADSTKKEWVERFQFDRNIIKEALTNKSVRHTLFELHFLLLHCKEATNFLLQPILTSTTVEKDYTDVIFPMVDAKDDFIQLGETYKSEVYLTNYQIPRHDSLIEMRVNGRVIPVEKGIGLYETKAKTVGKHTYHVQYREKNTITGKIHTDKKTFKYKVIDCK